MCDVQDWTEVRRPPPRRLDQHGDRREVRDEPQYGGVSDWVRVAPPRYERAPTGSMLDGFARRDRGDPDEDPKAPATVGSGSASRGSAIRGSPRRTPAGCEGGEEVPVGLADVEQGSDAAVAEVGDPEGHPLDPLHQVVHMTSAAHAARLFPSESGWFHASRQTSTAALSYMSA